MVVVAAVDRSDRAQQVFSVAVELAQAYAEPVHVVHALSHSEFVELENTALDDTGRTLSMEEVREFATEHATRVCDDESVECEPIGLVGNAAKRVVEHADDVDARYIVVGPRRRSPAGKVLFGSVAQAIILNASGPVVTTVGTAE